MSDNQFGGQKYRFLTKGTWQKMNGKNYGNYNISSDSINKRKLNGKQYGELHHYQF